MQVKILDDVLSAELQDQLRAEIFGWDFPWHYYANTNYADNAKTHFDDVPQFTHGFIRDGHDNSAQAEMAYRVLNAMGAHFNCSFSPDHILRAKANLLCREPKPFTHPPHTDDPKPHLVMIYYVHDSDGDTHLYNKQRKIEQQITPKQGRVLLFNGQIRHASASPVDHRFRAVINYNLTPAAAQLMGFDL